MTTAALMASAMTVLFALIAAGVAIAAAVETWKRRRRRKRATILPMRKRAANDKFWERF
jgi:predicted lysophospholipase L1 biosynthesis ABC-type transport system permease subunit